MVVDAAETGQNTPKYEVHEECRYCFEIAVHFFFCYNRPFKCSIILKKQMFVKFKRTNIYLFMFGVF